MGIADVNNFYGLVRFLQAACKEGIKPVAGVAVLTGNGHRFTAYVRDRAGYLCINGILTRLLKTRSSAAADCMLNSQPPSVDTSDYDPVDDLLENGWQGLVIATDDEPVLRSLAEHSRWDLLVKLTFERPIRGLARLAKTIRLPVLAVNDAAVPNNRDSGLYDLLRAIDGRRTIDRLPSTDRFTPAHRVATRKEMERYFSALPEALTNTCDLALGTSAENLLSRRPLLPAFRGMSREEACRHLERLCFEGVKKRYGRMEGQIERRLRYELNIIRRKHFSGYFLVVRDIISRCPRTCGRGSSAASIVSYLLGITHVDPLRYDLFFERFLNPDRSDPPDIDVDFPWDERDEVFRYVFASYRGQAAMVATHVTFGPRSSIRETAKAMGVQEDEIRRMVDLWRLGRQPELPEYIRRGARRIAGFPRYLGTHCGGVVITPGPILCHSHLQPSLLGFPAIAWEKDAAEDAGLVKIDLLGNRSLAVLRDTRELVEKRHGRRIAW